MVDIDNTILSRPSVMQDPLPGLRLYLGTEHTSGPNKGTVTGTIMPGCRVALQALRAAGWNLVAVTARFGGWPRCRANTEAWLESNGIPMPVIYASVPYPTDRPRAEFKARAIQDLQASGEYGDIVAGVGDRPSDMIAYAQNRLRCMVITDQLGEVGGADVHRTKLLEAEAKLRKSMPGVAIEYFETDAVTGMTAWSKIERALLGS